MILLSYIIIHHLNSTFDNVLVHYKKCCHILTYIKGCNYDPTEQDHNIKVVSALFCCHAFQDMITHYHTLSYFVLIYENVL